jgi:hypothetical protein
MQYLPDLRKEATVGELKEGTRNNDETRYIRDCDSTEEEEEHKNNLIRSFFCDILLCFGWCILLVFKKR